MVMASIYLWPLYIYGLYIFMTYIVMGYTGAHRVQRRVRHGVVYMVNALYIPMAYIVMAYIHLWPT